MILIAGLGNPEKKHQGTRHNIGREVVKNWQKSSRFSNFKFQKKFNALISKGSFENKKIILVLPETFMNLSGRTIKQLLFNYSLPLSGLWVIHDDIDIPLGKIRISQKRGSAGHKGIESIIKELKSKNFIRFRVGVLPKTGKPKSPDKFVLQKFKKDEERIIKETIKKTVKAIEVTLNEGVERAMSEFNNK